MIGTVYLVGAGPGDPSLLTVRAAELLRSAEVVAHDALISEAVLALIPPTAERLCVGRRGLGSSRAVDRIHPEVLARARAGKQVVRLKQGDPFIFGRGGEEAEELTAAGIPFEVVPGISAALGAAAWAGIPLTHRGISSDVTFATGHDLLTGAAGATDWGMLSRGSGTLVLYMARRKLDENIARLIAQGRSPETPAALISRATTARQQVVTATLRELPALAARVALEEPSLLVVGAVVGLRGNIAWRERHPLHGRRVVVARARPGESELAARLRSLGAEVIETPRIDIAPLADRSRLDACLARLGDFDALVFGCAAGVDALLSHLGESGRDLRDLTRVPWWAVGSAATARLRAVGISPLVMTEGACRDSLAGLARTAHKLLLITSSAGRPHLRAELSAAGNEVVELPAYQLHTHSPPPLSAAPDVVVLPSSSAAAHLYGSELGHALLHVDAIAIGPVTQDAALRLGATRVTRAAGDSREQVIEAFLRLVTS
jgi:uroporphyrinogen III methyltransferase / synthase